MLNSISYTPQTMRAPQQFNKAQTQALPSQQPAFGASSGGQVLAGICMLIVGGLAYGAGSINNDKENVLTIVEALDKDNKIIPKTREILEDASGKVSAEENVVGGPEKDLCWSSKSLSTSKHSQRKCLDLGTQIEYVELEDGTYAKIEK